MRRLKKSEAERDLLNLRKFTRTSAILRCWKQTSLFSSVIYFLILLMRLKDSSINCDLTIESNWPCMCQAILPSHIFRRNSPSRQWGLRWTEISTSLSENTTLCILANPWQKDTLLSKKHLNVCYVYVMTVNGKAVVMTWLSILMRTAKRPLTEL